MLANETEARPPQPPSSGKGDGADAPSSPVPPSPGGPASHPPDKGGHGHAANPWVLVVGALGVVYGDIGTSPLYAIKECFSPENPHHIAASPANVLGVLSLVFWSLTMVIVVKYLTFIMRADNHGEGGILALLALIPQRKGSEGPGFLLMLALFGTALLYGDGVITPAISVLSAVEGLEVATSARKPVVLPLTIAILLGLFVVQRRGTAGIGRVFGPMTLVWFAVIAVLGARQILASPDVLLAIDPRHAIRFFVQNGGHGFLVLGSVVLVVTGGEALYADMGHFGRRPIRFAWYAIVFPALLLNYFGQGALLLARPGRGKQSVLRARPVVGALPGGRDRDGRHRRRVAGPHLRRVLAHAAGGAARLLAARHDRPHVEVDRRPDLHPRDQHRPHARVHRAASSLFKSSTALAAAYGIAVTGTMAITTLVYFVVVTRTWGWSPLQGRRALAGLFLVFDLAFFGANAAKFVDGGWFPIAIALGDLRGDDDVEARATRALRQVPRDHAPPRDLPRRPGAARRRTRPRNGRLHGVERRRYAARAAAPLQAQPVAARAGRAAHGRERRRPRGRRGRASHDRRQGARRLPTSRSATASWRRRTSRTR